MKQFLLVYLIALPSLLLAQPTLTFSPANGAADVPIADPLTITSNEGLKTTAGVNLDNNNVDALISLVDGNSNPVAFDATVNGPRTLITITPSAPLQQLTSYTLTLQPVEGNGGQETTIRTITFQTEDITDPVFTKAQAIDNTGAGFTFRVNLDENATVYYVVDRDTNIPTETEVRNGNKSGGAAAEASGSFVANANIDTDVTITGLDFTPPVKFNIYFVAEDNASPENVTNVTSRGIPLLNSSSIPPASVNAFQFDLRVNVDEAVTTYYVVTQTATPPTSSQIIGGDDEAGNPALVSGSFAVSSANTDTDRTISGLNDLTTYFVHFVATDGAGNETIVAMQTTVTEDGTGPVITALSPPDDATMIDVSTNTFTITFDENVTAVSSAATTDNHRVRLFEEGIVVETINRNDVTIGANGSIIADGSSTTAVITFVYDLLPYKNYYVLVGDDVFSDASGNKFLGLSAATNWNITTSGVVVNNATSNICSGSFQSIGNIIISEAGAADFNNGASQTLVLSLDNTSEFVISNSGVSVSGVSADITSLSVTVGLTSLTVTYTVVGGTFVDNITISGLKIYATGAAPSVNIIRTGGTANQDGNNGTGASSLTHANINVGASPPAQPQLEVAQDLIHCASEVITSKTLTLVDQGAAVTYNWYRDASLTSLAVSTANETVNVVTDLGLTSPAVMGTYKFYVVAVSACQSVPPVEVVIQVSANPVADAGADKVGASAVCTGTQLTLGGNPTLAVPSSGGAYTYSWIYLESSPEPDPIANPNYTVTNGSTTSSATYNFEVTITDANGCFDKDTMTVEVKSTFNVSLQSPNSYTFTPNSPNQTLIASPPDGVFSGVGVVQSNAPSTYQFSPSIAHATDPNTLPKNFDIYYTVTQGGCTKSNQLIATFTIANSFFSMLQPEYCSSEYPDPNVNGVTLSLDLNGYTYVDNRKTNWNNSERFSRGPYNNPWQAGVGYSNGSYVRYNNEIYRCNNFLLGCSGFTAPDSDGQWVYQNILKVKFNGYIGNYYEQYYGGNASSPTIVKLGTTYTVGGQTYNHYRFGTNVNYNNCPTCNYAWPAAYLEFENPEDIRQMLPGWFSNYYYYRGDLVYYSGNVYQCTANPYTTATPPDLNPGVWTVVTNSDYSNGQYFHTWDASLGAYRSGFYVNGQYVQINRNPTAFFSGLTNGQGVCEFDVLNLDNPTASTGIIYNLTGNFSNQNFAQEFSVRLDGSGSFNDGGSTIVNNILDPGVATFDTRNAFMNSTGGAANVKNVEIRYQINPGTTGSTGQPCYGTSTITVQVVQNSTFDFDNSVVNPTGSVYCYTEAAKGLRSVANTVVINGASGAPSSVSYSGYGVNDFGNSLGAFRPGVAVDQVSPGTTAQQSIPVTAVYRDANLCRSTRQRTFKVNPDIQPSFTFGGRLNYCYEDIGNSFTGHSQNFTVNSSTVTSTGNYRLLYYDPANQEHVLETVNSNNTTFTAQTYYDQIQSILVAGNFTGNLNQTANVSVVYTESLNAGQVCSESFSQVMVINPPVVLDIFGLDDGDVLCRNDNSNVSSGNIVTFDGSVSGYGTFRLDDDSDFSTVNATLNSTVNASGSKANINLLSAYNAATDTDNQRQVYLQYNYTAPGCTGAADVFKGFKISPPPALTFDDSPGNTPLNNSIFCFDAVPVPLKTIQNTNVTLTGYGVSDSGGGSGMGSFNPGLAFNTSISAGGTINTQQSITVTARITDVIGCANLATILYKVNPTPQANVVFAKDEFCYEDAPGLIEGQQVKSWFRIEYQGVSTPHTDYYGDISNPVSSISFDPKEKFDLATGTYGASALSPANFNVYYSVADTDNCTTTIGPTLVSVANQIDVTIAGLDNNQVFCSNETNGEKVLTFSPFPVDASKRVFYIDGNTQTLTSDKFVFKPALLGGDYLLEYVVFSGENNCSNTASVPVKALPSPESIFDTEPACVGELVDFTADGTNNLSSATYTWTLVDSVRTGQSIQHRFPGSNLYGVKLKVAYPAYNNDPALVCQDSLRLDQVVGAIPGTLNFEHFNVCEGDQTSFGIQPDIPISQVSWDFADGASTGFGFSANEIKNVPETSGTYQSPIHRFPGQGTFEVVVTGKTAEVFGGCELTERHAVDILKIWSASAGEPYYDMTQLNGGDGFWVVEDRAGNSSWDFSTASKTRINTNETAWVTGADTPYNADDISYVNSPCFDLSSFSRPVLSLKHWTDTETSDGAVFQYSTDGGETWERLGGVASGLEWYNRLTISSNPGEQNDLSSGWSNTEQLSWAIGKHTLDVIPQPRTQVRFRVAFASFNNREGRDGFAFNNVLIEERNRTILVENFTNEDATANNDRFKSFRAVNEVFNPAELVKLQYHHASAVTNAEKDDLHLDNPVDQNARAAFYGVTNPVRAFIDGGFGQTSSNVTFESPNLENYFSLRSLVTSPVNISIDFLPELDPSQPNMAQLYVQATVQATNNIPAGQYNVFVAIAEQSVDDQVYVLRKFLPDASGTPLSTLSLTDPAQEIKVSYDMRHVTRMPDGSFAPFAVIVFVQHLQTKEVLQTFMRTDGTASSQIVTGIETPIDKYVRLYPNPADDVLNIILPAPVKEETPVKLFDSFGRQVYGGNFNSGEHVKMIETKALSSGVYLVQVATHAGLVQKKVMVLHE